MEKSGDDISVYSEHVSEGDVLGWSGVSYLLSRLGPGPGAGQVSWRVYVYFSPATMEKGCELCRQTVGAWEVQFWWQRSLMATL